MSTPSKKPRTKRTSERPSRSSDPHQVSAVVAPKRPEARTPTRRMRGLNGLRALAAAAVLAYHLIPHTMIGGFLGVDVFFVLSGFLITALLVREHAKSGGINLASFWLRRIRRLLPAVALMAVITLIIAGLLSQDLLAGILPQFVGVVTFSYNWVEILRGASYFDNANPHLWTNVWSLAVEQQFYLVWPIIVLGLVYVRKKFRWILPAALAVTSAGWMAWLVRGAEDFTRAYQGTDSHAFGLMLGAVLALVAWDPLGLPDRKLSEKWVLIRGFGAWVSLAAVIALWLVIPDDARWTYPWGTLLAVFATMGLIQGFLPEVDERPGPGQLLANILESRVLVWLGERSYGIYLWHWPIWVITIKMLPSLSIWVVAIIVIGLSVVAATLSFTFVENPMRQDGIGATIKRWLGPSWDLVDPSKPMPKEPEWKNYRRIMAPGLIAVLIVGTVLGFLLSAPDKTSAQIAVERGQKSLQSNSIDEGGAGSADPGEQKVEPGELPEPTGENVSIIGDSVTVAAAEGLEEKLPNVSINAEISRPAEEGVQIVQAAAKDGSLRPYVVVALATNAPVEPEHLDQILEAIGHNRRLVLVTGFGPARTHWVPPANDLIRDFAAKHKDQVRVADWNAAISEHPELLAGDYVHPLPDGAEIFANVVVEALNSFTDDDAATK